MREPATLVQRALAGHSAIGLLAGALIYIIALSGSLIVIHDRWQRWEQPMIVEAGTLSPAAAQAAMNAVLALEENRQGTTHLYIRMPTDDMPRAVVTTDHGAWYVDGTGALAGREQHAWTEFMIGLHEYLHLPMIWGLIVVGALGIALAAALVTGVLAHPRIVRDAFRLRTRHDPGTARVDWHNRLGVWTLPFTLAVTVTGAVIGLGSIGFTVIANSYTGGDLEAAYAPIFGSEPEEDDTPAPPPRVDAALAVMADRFAGLSPTYVIAHDPATRGQHVQVIAEHPRRLIYGETYAFDAAGVLHGTVGLSDGAIGQQAAASTYNLHFGNYGGLPVEIAYMLLGLALCVITATGTTLWLRKRERRGLPTARLAAAWSIVVWGTPLLMLAMLWLRAMAGAEVPLGIVFWAALAAALTAAALRPGIVDDDVLRDGVFILLGATGATHAILFPAQPTPNLILDMLMIASGVLTIARRVPFSFGSAARSGRQPFTRSGKA